MEYSYYWLSDPEVTGEYDAGNAWRQYQIEHDMEPEGKNTEAPAGESNAALDEETTEAPEEESDALMLPVYKASLHLETRIGDGGPGNLGAIVLFMLTTPLALAALVFACTGGILMAKGR